MTDPLHGIVEVLVGRIGRAHGIRGELTVEPLTDEPNRRFAPGVPLREQDGRRTFTVAGSRWHSGRLLVSFDEMRDRTDAEQVRGVLLLADVATDDEPTDDDEYWDRDLVGLAVLTAAGERAGEVCGVQHGPQDLLLIRTLAGEERLVPLVEGLVPEIDLTSRTLRLADVDGLLSDVPEVSDPGGESARGEAEGRR